MGRTLVNPISCTLPVPRHEFWTVVMVDYSAVIMLGRVCIIALYVIHVLSLWSSKSQFKYLHHILLAYFVYQNHTTLAIFHSVLCKAKIKQLHEQRVRTNVTLKNLAKLSWSTGFTNINTNIVAEQCLSSALINFSRRVCKQPRVNNSKQPLGIGCCFTRLRTAKSAT